MGACGRERRNIFRWVKDGQEEYVSEGKVCKEEKENMWGERWIETRKGWVQGKERKKK